MKLACSTVSVCLNSVTTISLHLRITLSETGKSAASLHEPGCFGVGWPGCHVMAKLSFVALNKHAEIPANSNQPV